MRHRAGEVDCRSAIGADADRDNGYGHAARVAHRSGELLAAAIVGLLAEALAQRQAEDQDEDERHGEEDDDRPPIAQ